MDIDYKIAFTVLAFCFGIGAAIDYLTGFYWVTAGLGILLALLINGFVISIEDSAPEGIDYNPDETPEQKATYRKMLFIQGISVIVVFILGVISFAYNHS